MAIAIGAAVAVGTSVVSSQINQALAPSGGGGGVGGGGSNGGNGQGVGNPTSNNNDTSNAIYGVHVSTQPLAGQAAPKPQELSASKAPPAERAENPRQTPTQSVGSQYASKDYQGVWADRLSKYLDYNTRSLG